MNLADIEAAEPKKPVARVLCIDVERLPGRITLDLFDPKLPSDYIHADRWDYYPETLCFAWRWLDERKTNFAATWLGDDLATLSHQLYDAADVVLGYNQRRADNRWLRDDWLLAKLPEPRPWRDIDLYAINRSQFAFEARSLDHLCRRLGVPGKRGRYDMRVAAAASVGDEKAQRTMERYNKGDIAATIACWERMRPLVKVPGVNLGVFVSEWACPKCGHEQLEPAGWVATAQTRYAGYRCKKCGGLARTSKRKHTTDLRGVV